MTAYASLDAPIVRSTFDLRGFPAGELADATTNGDGPEDGLDVLDLGAIVPGFASPTVLAGGRGATFDSTTNDGVLVVMPRTNLQPGRIIASLGRPCAADGGAPTGTLSGAMQSSVAIGFVDAGTAEDGSEFRAVQITYKLTADPNMITLSLSWRLAGDETVMASVQLRRPTLGAIIAIETDGAGNARGYLDGKLVLRGSFVDIPDAPWPNYALQMGASTSGTADICTPVRWVMNADRGVTATATGSGAAGGGEPGPPGADGADGANGSNGIAPYIGATPSGNLKDIAGYETGLAFIVHSTNPGDGLVLPSAADPDYPAGQLFMFWCQDNDPDTDYALSVAGGGKINLGAGGGAGLSALHLTANDGALLYAHPSFWIALSAPGAS